ncbi:MAG: hypothetical protein JJU13_05160 [Balneolaceae bacterium]|nr:hypothetical protein [Balneolaceae bacterium]
MTTLQKKQKLIEETEKLTDDDFIEYLLRLIESETDSDDLKIYPLTEMEKKAIDEAETDIKEGKVITNKEADEQIKSWL